MRTSLRTLYYILTIKFITQIEIYYNFYVAKRIIFLTVFEYDYFLSLDFSIVDKPKRLNQAL